MVRWFSCAAASVVWALGASAALASQPAPGQQSAIITLDTGETIRGQIVGRADGAISLSHPVLGRVSVPLGRITQTTIVTEGGATDPQTTALPATPLTQPSQEAIEIPSHLAGVGDAGPVEAAPKWAGSFEFGLTGSEGNTQQSLVRGAANLLRETERARLTFDGSYRFRRTEGADTENRLALRSRHEWKQEAIRLRPFVEGGYEFDEFRAFDWRGRIAGGLGVPLFNSDRTRVSGRLGGGVTRDFGGPDPRSYPEGLASVDLTHKVNTRLSLAAGAIYLPDLRAFEAYRLESRARLELALNSQKSLLLAVGVEDRFESDPGPGVVNSDFDYFVSLVYRF